MPCIIYADLESFIKRIDGYKSNPEKLSTTKICEHVPCRYSVSAIWAFNRIKKKHNVYRGEDCMKKFCEFLREHAMEIINFKIKYTINTGTVRIT